LSSRTRVCKPGGHQRRRPSRFRHAVEQALDQAQRYTAELRTEFHREIAAVRVDLIKWPVGLWVAVALAVIGLYFKH
jgi:hypothetical protein